MFNVTWIKMKVLNVLNNNSDNKNNNNNNNRIMLFAGNVRVEAGHHRVYEVCQV